ncbi:MAG TPA: hypothetical protein VJ824_08265, partial [Bacillota bacterium]|nr:hypothetical protein [Bacillota bacterium]
MEKNRSSNLAQATGLFVLFVNICLLLFILAPSGHFNLKRIGVDSVIETAISPKELPKPREDTVLEWRLVDTLIDGDWRVEKYREYEKQLDE